MPIYEFYCSACNRIYNFFAKTVNTDKRPCCPRCGRSELKRHVSLFAAPRRKGDAEGDAADSDWPVDDRKMEQALDTLATEAEGISEDDPRGAARLMRQFSQLTGLKYGPATQEAISRMEAGEDMEKVEEEMGDRLEGEEEPFLLPEQASGGRVVSRRRSPPEHDPTLYEL